MENELPKPDITIYLAISVCNAMKRGQFGMERLERVWYQEAVVDAYRKYNDKWVRVDATLEEFNLMSEIHWHVL